jgi:hypothetical protein
VSTVIRHLILAVLLLATDRAEAQPRTGSVALIDAFKFPAKAAQAHARLRASMEEAIAREGWTVTPGRGVADCGAMPECLAGIGRDLGVDYVLRISGERSQEHGYEVSLDLYSLGSGRAQGAMSSCDPCDQKRMCELAGKAAVDLLAKAVEEAAESQEAARRIAPPPAAPPVASPAPPAAPEMTPPPPAAAPAGIAWVPWTLIGAGTLGMAFGGWALYQHGRSSGSAHPGSPTSYGHDVYSSKTLGIASMAGGGVLALAGVVWLLVTPSRTVAVSASPNHVILGLRF